MYRRPEAETVVEEHREPAHACHLTRWTVKRELSARPDEVEAARRYLEQLHIRALPTDDGRLVLKETGEVVGRAELVPFGLRQLAARRPRIAP